MEKIIIRTKIISDISSAIIQEAEENEEVYDLINRLGKEEVLEKIYGEKRKIAIYCLKNTKIFKMEGKVHIFHGCI